MFKLVQTEKQLTTANFKIFNSKEQVVGFATVSGVVHPIDYSLYCEYMGSAIKMERCHKSLVEEVNDCYRPFSITIDGKLQGYVYQIERKSGFLKSMCIQVLKYNKEEYQMYSIGLGKDGVACCLYKDDVQVGLIEKNGKVYNDLHNYEMYDRDGQYLHVLLLYCFYKYMLTCFNPYTKYTKSVSVSVSKTTDKELLAKYNPSFKEECLRGKNV